MAIRWDKDMLVSYDGTKLDKVGFFVSDSGFSNLVLKIWTGDNASDLIYQDTIDQISINTWNEVSIDSLLILDSSLEYWVGFRVLDQEAGKLPTGRDNGPAISGYGDLVSVDEVNWESANKQNSGGNWNISLWVDIVNFY